MADPTDAHRQFAADARAMHNALTDEGFTDDQAVVLLCQLIGQPPAQPAQPARPDRRGRVAELLAAAGSRKSEPTPADDRASGLWNPPATEGAPAHE